VIVRPEICSSERTADGVRLLLKIPAELSYFEGHFPGCPVLPGVVQLRWAIELGHEHVGFAGKFRALAAVKFSRVILPEALVSLTLEFDRDTRELGFEYVLNDGQPCSSGTALFEGC